MPFDREEIKKSVRAQMFGHWSVLVPLAGGSFPIAYGLFIADDWKLPVFGGIVCLFGSIGAYAYRRLVKWDVLTEVEFGKAKIKFEAERNAIADKRERDLDAFRRELVSDGDSRDENLLDDLRNIANAFRRDRTWVENVDQALSTAVLTRVDGTFEACIQKLKRSFTMRQTAQSVRGEGRIVLLNTSTKILDEVQTAVEELGVYFAKVNKLSIDRMTGATLDDSDVASNMKELRAMLSSAEKAEDMRQQFISGASSDDQKYAEYLNADKQA
ncbi:hypothetical protein A2318_00055 [Candidatus Uhrbacteria bacterium RIFOXYB2_FULL_45_11]|uniref:Uncharacterized protein n=1 Tax=Candidatus Uhrbacteria bacterium RIFOXYB2_FULL_45_11 TaxID=1802421 RepID=A0A1F7W7A9_9BACT|nr:MAG: hypothetical protein A2318_00055 [Candidatus Uhrbacteria bacterium RIFOXYB2_FULL_45_11]